MFRSHVMVCGGTGCTSSGSDKIAKAFEDEILATGLENEVKVIRTGCFGLCEAGPVVLVYPEGSFYSHVKVEDVDEIVSEHLIKGRIVTRLLQKGSIDESGAVHVTIANLSDTDGADVALYEALFSLPPKYRVPLILTCLDGYTMRETAHMLGVPEGTVKARLHRARLQLRERLGEEETDDA